MLCIPTARQSCLTKVAIVPSRLLNLRNKKKHRAIWLILSAPHIMLESPKPFMARSPERQVTFQKGAPRMRFGSAPETRSASLEATMLERSRTTSGSEVGLELDPSRAKAIEVRRTAH